MKNISLLLAAMLLLASCQKGPSKEAAQVLILQKIGSHFVYEFFYRDKDEVRRLFDSPAEMQGLVSINRHPTNFQVLSNAPLLTFTDKAEPFITRIPGDSAKVLLKLAKANISNVEVKESGTAKDQEAIVEYTVNYTDPTPFISLSPMLTSKAFKRKSVLVQVDGKWQLKNKN